MASSPPPPSVTANIQIANLALTACVLALLLATVITTVVYATTLKAKVLNSLVTLKAKVLNSLVGSVSRGFQRGVQGAIQAVTGAAAPSSSVLG